MKGKFVFGLVVLLVFGLMVIGTLEAQTDNRLNGRWFSFEEGIETEYRFSNGNFESSFGGISMSRGTYTTNNGEITINETHIFGGFLNVVGISGLESKWYSRNEFIIAIRPIFSGLGLSDRQINETVSEMIKTASYNYSVEANSLILSSINVSERQVIILKKR